MKIANLILKIIATIYLLLMTGRNIYLLFICWDGICMYIIGFALFNTFNLWSKEQTKINIIYIVSIWLGLCIRYLYSNANLFDYTDFVVVSMQVVPICTTMLNYLISKKKIKLNKLSAKEIEQLVMLKYGNKVVLEDEL